MLVTAAVGQEVVDMTLARYSVTWIIAFLGCLVTSLFTGSLGLAAPMLIVFPFAVALGALVAAIGASFTANAWTADESRSRLLATTSRTEVLALILAIFCAPVIFFGIPNLSLFTVLLAFSGIVAIFSTMAAMRLRTVNSTFQSDAKTSLTLVAATIGIFLMALIVTCSFGLCMP